MAFISQGHFIKALGLFILLWGCTEDTNVNGNGTPQCANEMDDDSDGLIDLQDRAVPIAPTPMKATTPVTSVMMASTTMGMKPSTGRTLIARVPKTIARHLTNRR